MSRWCIQLWTEYEMRQMTLEERKEINARRKKQGLAPLSEDILIEKGVTPHWECDMLNQEERYANQKEGRICEAGLDFETILRLAGFRTANYTLDEWRLFDHDTGEEIPLAIMVKA